MSTLYNEVLADAKKIREVAIQDARNSIMDEILPLVNKMIAEEIANPDGMPGFEDTDEDPLDQVNTDPLPPVNGAPVVPAELPPAAPVDVAYDSAGDSAIPLAPASTPVGLLNLTPGPDGKVTISLDDLLNCLKDKTSEPASTTPPVDAMPSDVPPPVVSPPRSAGAMEPPLPPLPPLPMGENKQVKLLKVVSEKVNSLEGLLGNLTEISSAQEAKSIKDGLYVLYCRLQETKTIDHVSVRAKTILEEKIEKMYDSVDELFESTIYEKTRVRNTTMKQGKTATLKNLFEDVSDDLLDEEAQLSGLFDDEEVDECGDEPMGHEHAEGEEDDGSMSDLFGSSDMDPDDDDIATITLVDDDEVNPTARMGMGESQDLDDDMIVEISETELKEALASLNESDEDSGLVEFENDEEIEDEDANESVTGDIFGDHVGDDASEMPTVSSVRKPSVATTESKAANIQLKGKLNEADRKLKAAHSKLVESNLLNAKLIYATQFLKRGGLTKVQMDRVVECLDAAENIVEAKVIFNKLTKKLNERKSAPGTETRKPLRESREISQPVVLAEGFDLPLDDSRWEQMAGIRPRRNG